MEIIFNQKSYTVQTESQYSDLKVDYTYVKPVQDSVIGTLAYKNKKWNLEKTKSSKSSKHKLLVLILESPHKYEYNESGEPILPAQGKTGKQIKNKITQKNFVNKLDIKEKYDVLLVNPIQYQVSCYMFLCKQNLKVQRNLTTKIFRILFNKKKANLRDDFIKRLKKYSPDCIINCTTHVIRGIVKTAIKEAGYEITATEYHPCVW